MLLFLAIATGLVTAWLVFQAIRPLTERGVVTAEDWARLEDESMDLLNRRDRLVAELRDLEFEAALDKISARDMRELRTRYETEALELSRRIDEGTERYGARISAQVDAAGRAANKAAGAASEPAAAPVEGEAAAAGPVELGKGADRGAASSAPKPGAHAGSKPGARSGSKSGASAGSKPGERAASLAETPAAAPAPVSGPEGSAACVACHEAIPADATFCDRCGAPQLRPCGGCGAANRISARFCKGCGQNLLGEAT